MNVLKTAALLLIGYLANAQQKADNGKWVQLFNGKNLEGWTIKIKDHPLNDNFGSTFRVENGVMKVSYDQYGGVFKERFGHIFYKHKYSSYLLDVEYRFTGDQINDGPDWAYRNSGLMVHGQTPESMTLDQDFPISLEAQLLGGKGKEERTGQRAKKLQLYSTVLS